MNQDIQNIITIIQQAQHLTDDEKSALIKSAKDVDKALEIALFKLDRTEKVKRTTAILLEETIAELEQKRKAMEEHNRELEIEAALERVRSRSMAMHKSDELKEVIRLVLTEIRKLDILAEHAGFYIDYKLHDDMHIWLADPNIEPFFAILPYFDTPTWHSFLEAKAKGTTLHTDLLDFEEKNKFYKSLFKLFVIPEEAKQFYMQCKGLAVSTVLLDNVGLYIENFSGIPYSDEENKVLIRFGKVFQQTYTRFLDLQKAEAQAREAQIEIGLERVRSRAMAMQTSEELNELIGTVFTELTKLDLILTRSIIWVFDPSTNDARWWMANMEEPNNPMSFLIKYHEHPAYLRFVDAWKKQDVKLIYDLKGKEKIEWDDILFNETELKNLPDVVKKGMSAPERVILSGSFNNFGGINVASLEPLSDEHFDILLRFAKVFDLTYTRFLDLQKAEAQAREAQIETALEKVRSSSLAMHRSDEMQGVVNTVIDQLQKLNIVLDTTNILIFNNKDKSIDFWTGSNSTGKQLTTSWRVPYFDILYYKKIWSEKEKGQEIFTANYSFNEKNKLFTHLFTNTDFKNLNAKRKKFILNSPRATFVAAIVKNTAIQVVSYSRESFDVEEVKILKRFSKVFNQAYTRFLDLQKAEAQAREAQIEVALERVRSRTMAMQNSAELTPTADLMYEQLVQLGAELQGVAFAICDEDNLMVRKWTSIGEFSHPYNIEPGEERMYNAWKNHEEIYEEVYEGEKQRKYYEAFMQIPDFKKGVQKLIDAGHPIPNWQMNHAVPFKHGYLLFITTKLFKETQIFLRFGKVFEQTYTRFLDLQKAETQAREAKIEAAMEKVRARAMAMQKPDELIEVAQVLRNEMGLLGVEELETSSIYIHNEATGKTECWYSIKNENKLVMDHMTIELDATWVGRQMQEFYLSDKKQISIVMQGANRKEWINYCSEKSKALSGFYGDDIPDRTYHLYKFSSGYMGAASPGDISAESWDLLQRATTVFSLAYTRFSDLQIAEASTKEAIKQAALDRIRADIASMRTTKDLERITPLIWNELNILGIPFIRCGVFIMDDREELIHTFLSTPDGKAIAAIHIPYDTPGKIRLIPENWKTNTAYTDHWSDSDFVDFATALTENHVFKSSEQYLSGIPHGGFYLHFLPFLQGMLYVGNPTELVEDEINLIQSVADAFSSAYSRYEDFNRLEAAKKQVDSTLIELQATQKQLIQSEKMASLGELTAGIAHEIQNPLNFVNNFSELSNELIDEMSEELDKGDLEEAKAIAADIKQNLEKINHHGKRADGIVKGMLQHSRLSSGQKEPTDINALCDEYLRLAYHGLRAKDKSFNADFKTAFDAAIPKINIVAQDIGRVLLNIINNAFYAVNERKNTAGNEYSPTVTITTTASKSPSGDLGVKISIQDNGNGIPEKIKDKIFQPFFTTKPTGSGTGLGLSLAYDIVKAHGGEIQVESKEGEGSEFVILLPVV